MRLESAKEEYFNVSIKFINFPKGMGKKEVNAVRIA